MLRSSVWDEPSAEPPPPEPPRLHHKAMVAGFAAFTLVIASAVAWPMIRSTAAPAVPPELRAEQVRLAAAGLPCTREIAGADWVLNPCVPQGSALPAFVQDEIGRRYAGADVECSPDPTGSPSSPPATASTTPVEPTATALRRQMRGAVVAPTATDPTTTATPTATDSAEPTATPCPSESASGSASADPSASASPSTSASPSGSADPSDSASPSASADPSDSASPSGSAEPSESASPSGSAEPSESASPSGSAEPSESASPSGSASPSESGDPSPTDPQTPPDDPGNPPDPGPSNPPNPTGCPALTGPEDYEDVLEEAASDRVDCRDVSKIPNKDAATVLVATGDSITSAHLQLRSSDKTCGHVSQDHRGHPGNNGFFSYAGRYFNANKNIVDYYNFARTGYSTGQIIGAGPNDTDACGFPWGRNSSPLSMAEAEVIKAKEAGHNAYFVTTGGINDTNWTDVLRALAFCRGLEFVADRLSLHVNWANPKGKEGIFTEGGGCVLTLHNPITNKDTNLSATVPRFNGPAVFASIGNNANSIVNTMLDAGADKVVWMLYYDIVPAVTDAGTVAELMIRAQLPDWIAGRVPNLGPRMSPLIDPLWIGQAREVMTAINTNIIFSMPLRDHLQVVAPPDLARIEMQETGVSGSPHPNAAGHDRLAQRLAAGFDGL